MDLSEFDIPVFSPRELQRAIDSNVCRMDYDLAALKEIHWTRFGGLRLPNIDVFSNEGLGIRHGRRTVSHVRSDGIRDVLVSIPRSALITLTQDSRTIHLEPGTFAFCTTALPCDFKIAPIDNNDNFKMTHVRVSGNALRQRVPHIDRCCHAKLHIRPGASRIMQSTLESALSEGVALSPHQAQQFSIVLIDTIATAILDMDEFNALNKIAVSPFQRVRDAAVVFIQRNLSNPSLDVGLTAQYCNVSVRYLHSAFADAGITIGAYIRQHRLKQCRDSLRNPVLRDRSITEIALTCGFDDLSSFCRSYKRYFGTVPSEERRESARAFRSPCI